MNTNENNDKMLSILLVEDDKAAGLLKEITKIVKKHEPDVEVIEK